MKKFIVFAMVLVALASCESRSGQKAREIRAKQLQNPYKAPVDEKVVIIEFKNHNAMENTDCYKVKRIDKGVVQFVTVKNSEFATYYSKGDTIYCKF